MWQSGDKLGAVSHLDALADKEHPEEPWIICWAGELYWYELDGRSPCRLDPEETEAVLCHLRDGNYVRMVPKY